MDQLGSAISSIVILIVIAFGAVYAVTFVLRIHKPRGEDLEVTHQVKNIKADDPTSAMKKGYATLSKEQRDQVVKVYMKRGDDE